MIFGPDAYPWNVIGDSWGSALWCPTRAGKGLELEDPVKLILDLWVREL